VSRHRKTVMLIEAAAEILREHHPQTVRQCYYRLVLRQVIENTRSSYQSVSKALVTARREGIIPWEHIEDRLRRPRASPMWSGLADFAETAAAAYRRNVWESQPIYVETWLEKDALSGIFEDELDQYGVTLNVGRGFDGWDSIHNAPGRLGDEDVILYFGDFDPSGEDMVRSLRERLDDQGSRPEIVKCALTFADIERTFPPISRRAQTPEAQPSLRNGATCRSSLTRCRSTCSGRASSAKSKVAWISTRSLGSGIAKPTSDAR
jgi:hypothetical protein